MKLLITCFAVLTLFGCASAQLTVTTDLYAENPNIPLVMSATEAGELRSAMSDLEVSAEQRKQDLSRLAQMQFDLYALLWNGLGGSSSDLTRLRQQLQQHKQLLSEALQPLASVVDGADRKVAGYIAAYNLALAEFGLVADAEGRINVVSTSNCPDKHTQSQGRLRIEREREGYRLMHQQLQPKQVEVVAAANDVNVAYAKSLAPVQSDFKLGQLFDQIVISVDEVVKILEGQRLANYQAVQPAIHALLQEIEEFTVELADRYAAVNRLSINVNNALYKNAARVGRSLQTLRRDLQTDTRATDSLTRIVQSRDLYYSVIDRLQDAGDPVWRIVSARNNECLWNTEFSRTYFAAKGNTSVVVVRDAPADYRIQRANNNPAALVRGQLQVSRAVAGAAISIVSATTGVPADGLSGAQTSGAISPGSSSALKSSESLARRKAAAAVMAQRRQAALNSLSLDLRNILKSLAGTRKGDALYESTLRRFKASLEGHAALFQPEPPQ